MKGAGESKRNLMSERRRVRKLQESGRLSGSVEMCKKVDRFVLLLTEAILLCDDFVADEREVLGVV